MGTKCGAEGESSLRSCSRFFPNGDTKGTFLSELGAPRLNINPCVFSTVKIHSVASHLDEAVMGTLGDLLGPFQGEDVGGLAHVTIHARAKSDVDVDVVIEGWASSSGSVRACERFRDCESQVVEADSRFLPGGPRTPCSFGDIVSDVTLMAYPASKSRLDVSHGDSVNNGVRSDARKIVCS